MGASQSPAPGVDASYSVRTSGYRLWMVGDSILDNSYWNGVESNTTAEWLKTMMPQVEIKDRSTEELDSLNLLRCLENGRKIQVRQHYVAHRRAIGIPYDPPNGSVQPNPENVGPKDFMVVCVSGNDFALRGEMNPSVILGFVRKIIQFYKQRGFRADRLIYMTTYGPNMRMRLFVSLGYCTSLMTLYNRLIEEALEMCAEEGVHCLTLDDFDEVGGVGIPEPTPAGAKDLACRIQRVVLEQIAKEESR
mmetsp:Transcript_93917/g.166178  ORF Transcript_93917/g.166178 Transcript_93917/m.166178 type:complete len:249 (-) Transcript_93917:59-805(-)